MTYIDWDIEAIKELKYPHNRIKLALLPLGALQIWYASQDPKDMIFLANTKDFKRFWYFVYVLPTRFYRWLLKTKYILRHGPWQKV